MRVVNFNLCKFHKKNIGRLQAATSVASWLLSRSFLRIFFRRLSIAERSPLMLR